MEEEASTVTASEGELSINIEENRREQNDMEDTTEDQECTCPDSENETWYEHTVFDRYWKHYELAWGWYRYHCQFVQEPIPYRNYHDGAPYYTKNVTPSTPNNEYSENEQTPTDKESQSSIRTASSKRTKRRERRRRNKKRRKAAEKRKMKAASGESGMDVDESEMMSQDSFEMEITQEMVDFFATSAKHRKDRDRRTRTASKSSESDYIDISEVSTNMKKSTTEAPKERPGARRTEEMKKLYGSGAAMIHGMETAIQLNFDRNCDIKAPKYWPHLPLNIVFES